jgi:hypothetical protein
VRIAFRAFVSGACFRGGSYSGKGSRSAAQNNSPAGARALGSSAVTSTMSSTGRSSSQELLSISTRRPRQTFRVFVSSTTACDWSRANLILARTSISFWEVEVGCYGDNGMWPGDEPRMFWVCERILAARRSLKLSLARLRLIRVKC